MGYILAVNEINCVGLSGNDSIVVDLIKLLQ